MKKPRLGQNFLINNFVADREINYAQIKKDETVLEIGPGKGILTKRLSEKAKKVIVIEIDKSLVGLLKKKVPENVEIILGDALKIDIDNLHKIDKIVSNIPYQISSPLTFKLLNCNFKMAVLMYQKEFAERMVAIPKSKSYSRVSVMLYYRVNCELLETVPKTCFFPQPKVDSGIVRLIPRKSPPFDVKNEPFFFSLTKTLFSHRRKKIKTTLHNFYGLKDKSLPYLEDRVDELTPEKIAELSNLLFSNLKKDN